MVFCIITIIVLSLTIVAIYARDCKRKHEVLPLLSALVFIFLGKVLRESFDLSFVEIILISTLYISLLALVIKMFLSKK